MTSACRSGGYLRDVFNNFCILESANTRPLPKNCFEQCNAHGNWFWYNWACTNITRLQNTCKIPWMIFNAKIYLANFKTAILTIQGKTVFYSIQCKNGCLAASDLFHVVTQSIKFCTFYYHILKSADVRKRWFIK